MIHSFLLVGQSNMAGRGLPNEAEEIHNSRIKVLRNGRWIEMFTPVNPDRKFSGRNLAEKFADMYAGEHDVEVGLIPCADGGTSLEQWKVGGVLYDNAVFQARLAGRTSTIAGILWHQGEADCAPDLYPLYEKKLLNIIRGFREDLGLHDVPFLCGGLGDFLAECVYDEELKNYVHINEALKKIAASQPMVGYVPAEGLGANDDNLHFNTKSLMEFGARYYEVFRQLEVKEKRFCDKTDASCGPLRAMESL